MAGSARYTAILDANVLYPATLHDLLLSLARDGLYHARWSERIQDEWVRSLLAHRPDLEATALRRTCELMAQAVPDSCLPEEPIVATLSQQLSWSHFFELIRVKDGVKRAFYTDMCAQSRWSVRTLRERMDGMLFVLWDPTWPELMRMGFATLEASIAVRDANGQRESPELAPRSQHRVSLRLGVSPRSCALD